jgi:hypothetical protein
LAEKIKRLALILPAGPGTYKLLGVRLTSGKDQIPALSVDSSTIRAGEEGAYRYNGTTGRFFYDAQAISGAQEVVLEISQPNSWFEHYAGDYRDTSLSSHSLKIWRLKLLSGVFELPASELPTAAYYQLRLVALGKDGKVVGYVSDPINLQIAGEQIQVSSTKANSSERNK